MDRLDDIERKRQDVSCDFRDGISMDEFSAIAYKVMERMSRVRQIEIDGPRIKGLAESHSGRTTWWFTVDFNNWGHITGTRWTWSQKKESNLAEKYGDCVATEIKSLLKKRNIKVIDYSALIDADKNIGTLRGLNYKKRFWINKKNKLTTGLDAAAFKNEHVYAVIAFLKKRGFCNIKSIKTSNRSEFPGCVKCVSINGIKSFNRDDKFLALDEVLIEYDKGIKKVPSRKGESFDKGLLGMFLVLIITLVVMIMISSRLRALW